MFLGCNKAYFSSHAIRSFTSFIGLEIVGCFGIRVSTHLVVYGTKLYQLIYLFSLTLWSTAVSTLRKRSSSSWSSTSLSTVETAASVMTSLPFIEGTMNQSQVSNVNSNSCLSRPDWKILACLWHRNVSSPCIFLILVFTDNSWKPLKCFEVGYVVNC